jgi:hypothetical protein
MRPNVPRYYYGGLPYDGSSGAPPPQPPPDFSITVTPLAGEIRTPFPNSTDYTVNLSPLYGFSGTVTLSFIGLPPSGMGRFASATVMITTGPGSSTLKITAGKATPFGLYTLTVTGECNGLVHSQTVQLRVMESIDSPKGVFKGPGPVFVEGPIDPLPGDPVE